jgi:membrane protein
MKRRKFALLLRQTFAAWSAHDAPRLGAALAFYSILSLAPLLVLAMAIVAFIFGNSNAQEQIVNQVQGLVGRDGADTVRSMIAHAQQPSSGIAASLLSVATLLLGASGVFGELRNALNTMWDVKADPQHSGIWATIWERFAAFGMVLAVGFLLLASLLVSAGLAAAGKYFGELLPVPEVVASGLNLLLSLAGISVLFALILKYVPETTIDWEDVWFGAIATACLFTLGKYLIGLYLGRAAVGSAYGAAGSLVVMIVWIYYSSMVFLFGAEFTRMLQRAPDLEFAKSD